MGCWFVIFININSPKFVLNIINIFRFVNIKIKSGIFKILLNMNEFSTLDLFLWFLWFVSIIITSIVIFFILYLFIKNHIIKNKNVIKHKNK